MDDLNYVIARLRADGKECWEKVSRETGVPLNTLIKVARGHTKNPRYHTITPLVIYYKAGHST